MPDHVKNLVRERDLMPEHYTLLKTIYALPGEKYTITDQTIEVNGLYVRRVLDKDNAGRPLPVSRGNFTVQPGHFLPLATRVPNSFDGRYFGEVSIDLIVQQAINTATEIANQVRELASLSPGLLLSNITGLNDQLGEVMDVVHEAKGLMKTVRSA